MEAVMKLQRVVVGLTIVNLLLLVVLITQVRRAQARDVPDVLRGRAVEIVDSAGRVRASIQVHPANADVAMPDGTKGHPETAIFRLITEDGAPSVKLSASKRGGILVLGGESNPIYAQINGGDPSLTLRRNDGQQHVIKP